MNSPNIAALSTDPTSNAPALLEEPLSNLGLPTRCHLALCRGMQRGPDPMLGELLAYASTEVLGFPNVGAGCLELLVAELRRRGLHLRPSDEELEEEVPYLHRLVE